MPLLFWKKSYTAKIKALYENFEILASEMAVHRMIAQMKEDLFLA